MTRTIATMNEWWSVRGLVRLPHPWASSAVNRARFTNLTNNSNAIDLIYKLALSHTLRDYKWHQANCIWRLQFHFRFFNTHWFILIFESYITPPTQPVICDFFLWSPDEHAFWENRVTWLGVSTGNTVWANCNQDIRLCNAFLSRNL